jgi:CRP-like cAMP-binding protein
MRIEKQVFSPALAGRFAPRLEDGLPPAIEAEPSPKQNQLLAALQDDSYERLRPHLELVAMPRGRALHDAGDRLRHAIFPTTSIVSLQHIMSDGASAAMAIAGNDAVIGVSLFMNGGHATHRAVVQTGGHGYRLSAAALRTEFARNGDFQRLALGYTQALLTQTALTAVCNCHHLLGQKLCRLLLLTLDRLSGDELTLTQELIASSLGVRRESVTDAAFKLQADGLIRYHRGRIRILDRFGLEARVCECYAAVKCELDRLLPQKTSTYLQ